MHCSRKRRRHSSSALGKPRGSCLHTAHNHWAVQRGRRRSTPWRGSGEACPAEPSPEAPGGKPALLLLPLRSLTKLLRLPCTVDDASPPAASADGTWSSTWGRHSRRTLQNCGDWPADLHSADAVTSIPGVLAL